MSVAGSFDAFLIDLDGVVWRGDQAIDGAADAIGTLRAANKRVIFVTNNASKAPRDYAAKLIRMRIPTEPQDIVTSAHAVVGHLRAIGLERPSLFDDESSSAERVAILCVENGRCDDPGLG